MYNLKMYDEWSEDPKKSIGYVTLDIDKIPFYTNDELFTISSFFGYKIGDKVYICSKEKIEHKYDKIDEFTASTLKQNILSDKFIYTKKHKIENIKLIFEFDKDVKKKVVGADVSFVNLAQVFTITDKNQLFKLKTEKVKSFQDNVYSKLTFIFECYISLKKSTSPPPPPPSARKIPEGYPVKDVLEDYLRSNKKLADNKLQIFVYKFFEFMTALFSFDFSGSEVDIKSQSNKLKKLLTKTQTVDNFQEKIKEHEEYGRSIEDFVQKVAKREKIKSILFDKEE